MTTRLTTPSDGDDAAGEEEDEDDEAEDHKQDELLVFKEITSKHVLQSVLERVRLKEISIIDLDIVIRINLKLLDIFNHIHLKLK